jgi:hypothetical protein
LDASPKGEDGDRTITGEIDRVQFVCRNRHDAPLFNERNVTFGGAT